MRVGGKASHESHKLVKTVAVTVPATMESSAEWSATSLEN